MFSAKKLTTNERKKKKMCNEMRQSGEDMMQVNIQGSTTDTLTQDIYTTKHHAAPFTVKIPTPPVYITSTKNSQGLPIAIRKDCRLPDMSSGIVPSCLGIGTACCPTANPIGGGGGAMLGDMPGTMPGTMPGPIPTTPGGIKG